MCLHRAFLFLLKTEQLRRVLFTARVCDGNKHGIFVALCVILLCGIARDLHAQAGVHRFGSPMQRRFPPTITTSTPSPTQSKEVSTADVCNGINKDIDNELK